MYVDINSGNVRVTAFTGDATYLCTICSFGVLQIVTHASREAPARSSPFGDQHTMLNTCTHIRDSTGDKHM